MTRGGGQTWQAMTLIAVAAAAQWGCGKTVQSTDDTCSGSQCPDSDGMLTGGDGDEGAGGITSTGGSGSGGDIATGAGGAVVGTGGQVGGFMFPSAGAPPNDYGQPQQKISPDPGHGGIECPSGSASGVGSEDPCLLFWSCTVYCAGDIDCPGAGSGDATPACRDGQCVLPCSDSSCPEGMHCINTPGTQNESICLWPEATAAYPDCPGYCYTEPQPRECPGYCADELIGCDRDNDDCCEGLICAPWGTCEVGTCLQPTWPCPAAGRDCCEGSSCVGGVCNGP